MVGWQWAGSTVGVNLCSVSACLREFGRVGERRHLLLGCRVDRSYSIIGVVSKGGPAFVALARLFEARAGPKPQTRQLDYEGRGRFLVVFGFITSFIFTAERKRALLGCHWEVHRDRIAIRTFISSLS